MAAVLDGVRKHAGLAETGDDGRYVLALPPGRYRLWAFKDAWSLDAHAYDQEPIEVKAGETMDGVDLTLVPGAVVTGVIRRSDNEQPIAGATASFARLQFASTDGDGRFHLEGIPAGRQMIFASADGFTRTWTEADVVLGASPSILLELEPAGSITGIVSGLDGLPLAGAEVETVVVETGIMDTTDGEGSYLLEAIPLTARDTRITASLDGRFRTHAPAPPFPEGESTVRVDIQLQAGLSLAGRVVDIGGKPVPEARLFMDWATDKQAAVSDSKGNFVVEGADERSEVLTARKQGYAPASRALRDLSSPEERESIQLVLEPGHFVAGKVVDSAGKPLRRAWVYVDPGSRHAGPYPRGETDDEGRFRFDDLPAKNEEIGARKPGYRDNRGNPVPLDRDNVLLVLEEAGQIEGLVVEQDTGKPVEAFSVRVDYFTPDQRVQHYPGGRFRLQSGLIPGKAYGLAVVADDYRPAVLDKVKAWRLSEEHEPLQISLARGQVLSGEVVSSETREILAGVKVAHVNRRDEEEAWTTQWFNGRYPHGFGWVARTAVTNAQGVFTVTGITEEPGLLFLEKRGFARTVFRDVRPNTPSRIFALPPGAAVEGTVRSSGGEPHSAVEIQIEVERSLFPGVISKSDGTYRIEDLPAGSAFARFRPPGAWEGVFAPRAPIELRSGTTARLDMVLADGSISGMVTRGGEPMPAAQIAVRSIAVVSDQEGIRTDDRGRYRVRGLPPGRYTVEVEGGPVRLAPSRRTVEVGAGETRCDIEISWMQVAGRIVHGGTGEPVRGAHVRLYGTEGFAVSEALCSALDDTFRLDVPSAGAYLLEASSGEGARGSGWLGPLTLSEGESLDGLVLPMAGGGVTFLVRDAATKELVRSPRLHVECEVGFPGWMLEGSEDGSVAVEELAPGSYTFEVDGPEHLARRFEIEVTGTVTEHVLALESASWMTIEVSGKAPTSGGRSVLATVLSGGDPGWPRREWRAGRPTLLAGLEEPTKPGRFRLKIRPGNYRFRLELVGPRGVLSDPKNIVEEVDVTIGEGTEARIDLGAR